MSHINISFSTVDELINNFYKTNLNYEPPQTSSLDITNFVLVYPKNYYGSYGGVIRNEEISNMKYPYLFEPIDENFSIIWWLVTRPPRVGTRLSLEDGRVLVSKNIFDKLKLKNFNNILSSGKSSYYENRKEYYC